MFTVLSLCDYTGEWSKPYREAGYDVRQIDLRHGSDVRLFEALPHPVRGVLAAPPCTHFSLSGAPSWAAKGEEILLEALSIVDACLRIVVVHRPQWWVLENPVGRIKTWLGAPRFVFDPCDYGDAYTKRTCLWGDFKAPMFRPVTPVLAPAGHHSQDIARGITGSFDARGAARSVTPAGFANAFFAANP